MTIGFIGGGNMAGAIIKGLLAASLYRADEIAVADITPEASQKCAARLGVQAADTAQELIRRSETVVLAVKPVVFSTLLPDISPALRETKPLLISIAAGKTLDFIEKALGFSPALVRVMPNINAKAGAAMSAFCANQHVTQEHKQLVAQLFGAVGQIRELDESFFPLFGVIAGSAPAFAYLFIDSLARAAVRKRDGQAGRAGDCSTDCAGQRQADFGKRRASMGLDRPGLFARRHHHRGHCGLAGKRP